MLNEQLSAMKEQEGLVQAIVDEAKMEMLTDAKDKAVRQERDILNAILNNM